MGERGGGRSAGSGAAGAVLPVIIIVVLGYLDWLTHRNVPVVLVGGAIAIGIALFRSRISARLLQVPAIARTPGPVRTIAVAAIPLLYFAFRGEGTSGAGALVLVVTLVVVGATQLLGPSLDRSLIGFYAARDRLLPGWLRATLVPLFAIFVTFLLVHGSLADVPALFGGTTGSPASPAGREGRLVVGILLSAAAGILLLREARE